MGKKKLEIQTTSNLLTKMAEIVMFPFCDGVGESFHLIVVEVEVVSLSVIKLFAGCWALFYLSQLNTKCILIHLTFSGGSVRPSFVNMNFKWAN